MNAAPQIPTLPLNDGRAIPQLGFGTWQVEQPDAARVVGEALKAGYRHVDTAQMYGNERGVGEAMRRSGLDREAIYLTSKLSNDNHQPDDARRSFEQSLQDLQTDYVDLFLIHWPLPTRYGGDFVSTWRVLEEFHREGRARSIGVSNFRPQDLDKLAAHCEVTPAVNQIEAHPYFTNDEVRAASRKRGMLIEAWSPLARGGELIEDPAVTGIAAAVDRTPAQVVLRWHVQRGDVIFPKSSHAERMRENLRLFDFELSDEQMATLTALDQGEPGRVGPNPDTFEG
ncbi:aldo/keto reductase [Alienimonas californiensis]|uniref:Putative oxidoreductase n=1 Tax=Alienimonas californiensis TaxID=2527989 RepID=A0A517P583_9PLAN|nr:aldo/keto reductase [Alienimonas californiensis]QDT14539.1 putative oxidoreductase [Alienimonas californiensis]